MCAAVAGPVRPPDAAAPADPAGWLLCAAAPSGKRRHDRPGAAVPRVRSGHHPTAAPVLADNRMGTPQSLVQRRTAARPAAGRNHGSGVDVTAKPGMVVQLASRSPPRLTT